EDAGSLRGGLARETRCSSRQGADSGRVKLSRGFLEGRKAASVEILPGGEEPAAGDRGRRFRKQRRAGLPHGERILLPQQRGDMGRGVRDDQVLASGIAQSAERTEERKDDLVRLFAVARRGDRYISSIENQIYRLP